MMFDLYRDNDGDINLDIYTADDGFSIGVGFWHVYWAGWIKKHSFHGSIPWWD